MVTREQLWEDLKNLGVLPTDTLTVHTALRSVGPVEGGADGYIDALRDYLQEGLLLIPTHTWMEVTRENPRYDVRSSVPCIGTVPRVAAFRPDGVRSLHPTHSVWACGKNAESYIAGEELARSPAPVGSVLERLARAGGKILLAGVGHNRNTFIHTVDELGNIPDRLDPEPYTVTILDREGNIHTHPYRGHKCSRSNDVSAQYPNFEEAFTRLGVHRIGKIGNAQARLVDAAACRDTVLRIYSRADRDPCVEKMEIPESWYMP